MPDNEGEPPTVAEGDQSTVWQRLSLKQLRWTALALVLVVTAAFGGLKTAHHVTIVSFGQPYRAGALTVTARSVSIVDHFTGLPRLSSECRFVMLTVTIDNTAHETVPFPLPGVLTGQPGDCGPSHPRTDTDIFELSGVAGQYAATFRRRETIPVPSIDAGFTYDYSVLWVAPRAELAHHPLLTIRFHNLKSFISTFVLSHRWAGDADRYGELHVPVGGAS